jgi:hypothetical protein
MTRKLPAPQISGLSTPWSARPSTNVEPAIGKVANARREPEPEQMADAEDMGHAARVGVVFLDGKRSLMVKKTVKNMERFACIDRNDFRVEGGISIGDVSIELDARLRTVASIVLGAGFAMSAGPEELTVRMMMCRRRPRSR